MDIIADAIGKFFSGVPAVFWSALAASIGTIIGIGISNRSNTNRLLIQLEHDRIEKRSERVFQARRSTYMELLEELNKTNSYLSGLPSHIRNGSFEGDFFQGLLRAAGKARLLAMPETSKRIGDTISIFLNMYMELFPEIIKIQKIVAEANSAKILYDQCQEEIKMILKEKSSMNEKLEINQQRFSVLQKMFSFQMEQSEKYVDQQKAMWKEFLNVNMIYCNKIIVCMEGSIDIYVDGFCLLRSELSFETDRDVVRQEAVRQIAVIKKSMENVKLSLEHATENS